MNIKKERSEQFIEGFDDDIGSVMPFNDTITSYGADFPVESIVRRIQADDLYVPNFQRKYIWSRAEASRFIESLLLGLPVPGVFLAKDFAGRHMIIDGQQRLLSLYYFVSGDADARDTVRLTGIGSLFNGKTFDELDEQYKVRLLDSIIHATIVRQDNENYANSSIFHLFERLNSGGKALEPQEIRNCLYPGDFQNLLTSLNCLGAWRAIYGVESLRYQDQELILRYIALRVDLAGYSAPLKLFLNNFMGEHKGMQDSRIADAGRSFEGAIQVLYDCYSDKIFKPTGVFNAAVYDSVMLGVASRLDHGPINKLDDVRQTYEALIADPAYQRVYKNSPSTTANLVERITIAVTTFDSVR